MTTTAKLIVDDKSIDLPVVEGTEKERGVDIGKLRSDMGVITLDPGFVNTGSTQSDITFIDGEKGILRYRGYPIEQLAEHSSFLEVAYLLIKGELPKPGQLEEFKEHIRLHTMLHEDFKRFYSGFPKAAHPMAIMAAVVGTLSTFYPDSLDIHDERQVEISTYRLLAKMPTIAAYSYKHSIGQPFMYPNNKLDLASNFLYMMFGTPCDDYEVDPVIAKALDQLLILHADHEQNCSTSTVRIVGSSHANLFASISSGVNALWGPLHGGANQAVIEMLREIDREGITGKQFLDQVKDKKSNRRLMGFGHRVYKNFDPRARIIKQACSDVLDRLDQPNHLLELAMELEEVALKDEYFIQRRLYPNVDFWIAHWSELHQQNQRIGRPRQVYQGPGERDYVPMHSRG
jgi:citrate synthase